ncbi:hypothetical protein PM082_006702 [Marasmius tenuissimus]|nr:hypothetical protein PM082_006702 [Marasmius tenuissimus]
MSTARKPTRRRSKDYGVVVPETDMDLSDACNTRNYERAVWDSGSEVTRSRIRA